MQTEKIKKNLGIKELFEGEFKGELLEGLFFLYLYFKMVVIILVSVV